MESVMLTDHSERGFRYRGLVTRQPRSFITRDGPPPRNGCLGASPRRAVAMVRQPAFEAGSVCNFQRGHSQASDKSASGPTADILMALAAVRRLTMRTIALQKDWWISRQQVHATSSFITPTIRTASGSARPRTFTSRTENPLIPTPAVAATMSDTTS
jgi:hypothetical protein